MSAVYLLMLDAAAEVLKFDRSQLISAGYSIWVQFRVRMQYLSSRKLHAACSPFTDAQQPGCRQYIFASAVAMGRAAALLAVLGIRCVSYYVCFGT